MLEEKNEAAKPPAELPTIKQPAAPTAKPASKTWKYVGPKDNDVQIRIPGDPGVYHPDDLPQQHIEFYIASTPSAAAWWQ